jgi:hypothetical protein
MLIKPAPTQQLLDDLEKVKAAISDICRWAEHVVAEDVFPREFPKELDDIIGAAFSSCQTLESGLRRLQEEEAQLLLRIIVKKQRHERLSEEEYYLLRAIGDAKPDQSEYEAFLKSLP